MEQGNGNLGNLCDAQEQNEQKCANIVKVWD